MKDILVCGSGGHVSELLKEVLTVNILAKGNL